MKINLEFEFLLCLYCNFLRFDEIYMFIILYTFIENE